MFKEMLERAIKRHGGPPEMDPKTQALVDKFVARAMSLEDDPEEFRKLCIGATAHLDEDVRAVVIAFLREYSSE